MAGNSLAFPLFFTRINAERCSANHSFLLSPNAHRSETIPLPTVTIDRLCADWQRLDLIKIDAEGAESLIWDGIRETRRRFPDAVIVLELHVPRDPTDASTLLDEIQAGGYALQAIQFDGSLVSTSPSEILTRPYGHWTLWLE